VQTPRDTVDDLDDRLGTDGMRGSTRAGLGR
jgi:hypothetical protein